MMKKPKHPKGWTDWKAEQERLRKKREAHQRAREESENALFGTEEGRWSRLLVGVVTAIAGVPAIMIGIGLWDSGPALMHAPISIILCMGLLFVCGGASVAVGAFAPRLDANGDLPQSAPHGLRALQFFLSACAAAGLAGVGTWAVLSGKMHDLAHLLGLVFPFADPGVLELRLKLWLACLSALLWITALIGAARGLARLHGPDAETRAS